MKKQIFLITLEFTTAEKDSEMSARQAELVVSDAVKGALRSGEKCENVKAYELIEST